MDEPFDVVVLGSGNAGMAAATKAQGAGQRVLVVEAAEAGGVCPTRGCVPKKVLVAAAQTLDAISRAGAHHIHVERPRLDWPALMARKETFVAGVPEQFEQSLAKRGITFVRGHGKFVAPDAVDVNGSVYRADRIVVATGSSPRPLPIPGAEHLVSSDQLLELPELPGSITFVGAGVIAFEFAHVFARAGTQVTLLEVAPRVLPSVDADAAEQIAEATRALGVRIEAGVSVDHIHVAGPCREIQYRDADGATRVARSELGATGAGRVANLAGLALHAAGVTLDQGYVKLDPYLRSVENSRVFFAGDAVPGRPQLSPLASHEGRVAGHNLVSDSPLEAEYGHQPAAIYTVPSVATVGLTEEQARDQGRVFQAHVNDMREWRSARTYAETTAWSKVLVEDGTDRILGAHLVGHGAEETIHTFALAIEKGLTATEIRSRVYAYPTFHSDLKFLVG